ncbi:MAG: cadmium resistance transporter, partial [Peptoniphilus harei]|nr:cadmium resistance transporter [Peptoniphilus harei]
IPQDWIIGLLGLIPLGLGIRAIFVDEDIDEEDIKGKITGNGSKILAFTSLTVAMGGDNLGIYIPYFTGKSLIEISISLVIFALGILILCKLSHIANHKLKVYFYISDLLKEIFSRSFFWHKNSS